YAHCCLDKLPPFLFSIRIIRYNLQPMILQIKCKTKHVYLMNKITKDFHLVKEMPPAFPCKRSQRLSISNQRFEIANTLGVCNY
ncbi:MAG: hypothetical protein KAW82_06675, partial [Desulfurellaceae bacterium]|nr:hypothetical protein [Desulfurellaceae bacterium]